MTMRQFAPLVLLSVIATSTLAAEIPRPRGVGPEFARFYKSKETFSCITTPSLVISADKVNDEFCDCPDGSDEPGTAACTHLSILSPEQPVAGTVDGTSNITVALPGFYCKNKGHQSSYIPFTLVNDGICDYELCCDGSDEWGGVGGVRCPDECGAIGKEWKKKEAERNKATFVAGRARADLVKQAADLKTSAQQSIERLHIKIEALEVKVATAKKSYEDVERSERGKVSRGANPRTNKVTMLARLAKDRVEELREALQRALDKRIAATERTVHLEAILSLFKEEYNPNFNDEGVKRAIKAWDDYLATKLKDDNEEQAEDRDMIDIVKPDSDTEGIDWAEWEKYEEESDVDILYRFEEYLPTGLRNWIQAKITDLRVKLVENGILADITSVGTESKAVIAARDAFQNINDELDANKSDLGNHQRDLEKDYGPDEIFRALKGKCVAQDAGEYTYELCWMEKATQKSQRGGGSTGMGDFIRFETTHVDEGLSGDGKGLGKGERIVMKYENGQHCWNGPARQTTVIIACAEKNEIWKVAEEEKCMYRMEVGSPAACEGPKAKYSNRADKDEL